MQLAEQYRPTCWAQVVAQERAVKSVQTLAARGLAGRAFWISGKSGTGKTTIARLIAADVADGWATLEIDAGRLGTDVVDEIEKHCRYVPLGKGRAYIVNEAHGLRAPVVRRLLVLLEKIGPGTVWVFTTTHEAQAALFDTKVDADALLSRCIVLALAQRNLNGPFAAHLKAIAKGEGLDGKPIDAYRRLLNVHGQNLRRAMQAVEAGEMTA